MQTLEPMKRTIFSLMYLLFFVLILASCQMDPAKKEVQTTPTIMKAPFGTIDEQPVYLYTLENIHGIKVMITNYGGIITQIWTPDRKDKFGDIVLGYDSLADYVKNNPYFGAIVGRYANRIADGSFELDGKNYKLATNDGANHLHGGDKGFDKVVWTAEELQDSTSVGLRLHYISKDGEEGYPGNLDVEVRYILNNDNELITDIRATTDKPTPVNICNHTYFNLTEADTNVLGHILSLAAAQFTDVSSTMIPTGVLPPVAGTPMDFNTPHQIGSHMEQVKGGYDHNYVLDKTGKDLALAGTLKEPKTGREVKIFTTQPGIQFYSGNFLDGSIIGKGGKRYDKHYGVCLETQHFPDSPNHDHFPNTILKPGETYHEITVYKFAVFN
jgi:aldose 1-epimerase